AARSPRPRSRAVARLRSLPPAALPAAAARPPRERSPAVYESARPRSGPAPATGRAPVAARSSTTPRAPRARETGGPRQAAAGRGGAPRPVRAPDPRERAPLRSRRGAVAAPGHPVAGHSAAAPGHPGLAPAGHVPGPCSSLRLWVCQPAAQRRVEPFRLLLGREVTGSVDQAPPVRAVHVAGGRARAGRPDAGVERTVQVQGRGLDGD